MIVAAVGAEIYLAYHAAPRVALPFYNRLYPYVMFRPYENYTFETAETYEMSHHRSRVFVYTNEDGFRISAPGYRWLLLQHRAPWDLLAPRQRTNRCTPTGAASLQVSH